MTKERAKSLVEALLYDDEEPELGNAFGVNYYPDGDYIDEVTVEIAEALEELSEIKQKYNLE